eukprot:jgi/Tetstr1/437927/TSEL_026557.t1
MYGDDGQPSTPPRTGSPPPPRRSESPPPVAPSRRPRTVPSTMTTPRQSASRIPLPSSYECKSTVGTPRGLRSPYAATPRHSAVATPRTSINGTPRHHNETVTVPIGIKYEMDRLQSELSVAREQLASRDTELHTLQAKVRSSGNALGKKAAVAETLESRALKAEQGYATMWKEFADMKKAKLKLESQLKASEHKLDKLSAKMASAPASPNVEVLTKDMQSEITALKRTNKTLEETVRARESVIRAKDKELTSMGKQVAEVEALRIRVGELDNKVQFQFQQLNEMREEVRTARAIQRQKEADFNDVQKTCDRLTGELGKSNEACADLSSELEVAYVNMNKLDEELCATMEKLHRSESVASRVARFEQEDGLHGDGTVPFKYFLNETNYLKGEVRRLKEKLRKKRLEYGDVCDSVCPTDRSYWAPTAAAKDGDFNFEESNFGPATLQRYATDLGVIPINVHAC